jgi:two-component sensor histidine kinase
MALRILILLIIIGSSLSVDGQSEIQFKIDSVLVELESDIKPRARINRHLKLVSYYNYSHPDVDSLIETALSIAQKRNFTFFIARSLKFRARYRLYMNADPELIRDDIDRIDSISKTFKNKLLPGWVSQLYAEYYILTGELIKAQVYIDSLTVQIEYNKWVDKGSFHTIRGMFYQAKKEYTKAMSEYNIALTKKTSGKTFIFNNLSKLHLELLDSEKAISFANQSLEKGAENLNNISRILSYHLLGQAYLMQEDTMLALKYFWDVEKLRSLSYIGKNYTSISQLIDILKKEDENLVDSLLSDISSYKLLDVYSKLLTEKGLRLIANRKLDEALDYCQNAYKIALNRLRDDYASFSCDCIVDIYSKRKNTDKVAKYLALKIEHQAKLQDEKRIISLARNLATFETEKEKALLEQAHNKDQQIMSEKINKYKLGGLLGSIILTLGAVALWHLRKRNKRIDAQNKVIRKALSEKDILLREIHHRVKNNLQLVSSMLTLQGRSIDDESALQAINEGKSRVRSMALIHQDLYSKDSITGIGVTDYLNRLTNELFTTYNIDSDRIKLETEIQEIELDIDTLVPLGLIINELFSNCLKYAFPENREGILSISLKDEFGKLNLSIKDNGIGFDPNNVGDSSFGTTLISALTDQLEGEMTINTENGTQVNISFSDYKVMN